MKSVTVGLCCLLSLGGCAAPSSQDISITFALKSGDHPVSCSQPVAGLGKSATLTDARLYIHDVVLLDDAGHATPIALTPSPWQRNAIVLLDFEDASGTCRGTTATNNAVVGTVPAGRYVGLGFVVGVPSSLNHTSPNAEAAPLDLVAMGWSWQAGRKFIKIELDPEGGVVRAAGKPGATWNLHVGSTGCVGDPFKGEAVSCATPNRVSVRFPAFSADADQVVLDIAAIFDGTDIGRDGGGALGCMSGPDDPDCLAIFRQLGLKPASNSNPPPAFRVVPKG